MADMGAPSRVMLLHHQTMDGAEVFPAGMKSVNPVRAHFVGEITVTGGAHVTIGI